MRQLDPPDPQPALGERVASPPPAAKREQWTPIASQPGYVRNDAGAVKRDDQPLGIAGRGEPTKPCALAGESDRWTSINAHLWGSTEETIA